MKHFYSSDKEENVRWSLPNVETFYLSEMEAIYNRNNADHATEYTPMESGWYWWTCMPGCLPDSSPFGPFESEEEARWYSRELLNE